MKFKVGDLVTGKHGDRYRYTTDEAIMRVLGISTYDPGYINVQILNHLSLPSEVDGVHDVDSAYFEKVEL